jgi:hypothetical protein
MTASNMEIAKTILEQIGGRQFTSMTGAKNLVATQGGLHFKLPRGMAKDGITNVLVVLEPSDTYTVSFHNSRGTVVASYGDTYCDQLRGLFEDVTGLRTSLTAVYGSN